MPTGCPEKVNELGARLACAPVPVPVRLMVWVAGLALSETVGGPRYGNRFATA